MKTSHLTTLALASGKYTMRRLNALYKKHKIDKLETVSDEKLMRMGIDTLDLKEWACIWLKKTGWHHTFDEAVTKFEKVVRYDTID